MNCFLISGQFSNQQFKCFTFESDRKTTTTYDLKRVRGNSCELTITARTDFIAGELAGLAKSSTASSSESCSYVPECASK